MGVTIRNKYRGIDMGCGGFYNLRKNIAGLLGKEFQALYITWCGPGLSRMSDEDGNKLLSQLYKDGKLTDDDDDILDFLFASDCEGKCTVKCCRKLYKLIKDYDDDIVYGYVGRPDRAMFKDFKAIVAECCEKRIQMSWY